MRVTESPIQLKETLVIFSSLNFKQITYTYILNFSGSQLVQLVKDKSFRLKIRCMILNTAHMGVIYVWGDLIIISQIEIDKYLYKFIYNES